MAKHKINSDKIWADAVRRAVMRRVENQEGKPKKIERLADKVVELGMDGDVAAIKEIGDRLDGKAVAKIEGDVNLYQTLPKAFEFAGKDDS